MSDNPLSAQSKIDRLMCQRDMYYLCKEVLNYKDFAPHVHGDMCHFATSPDHGRFRSACVPRSWFKTWTFTIAKAIWLTLPDEENLYHDIYPYKGADVRILIASNVIDNAAKMVNKIKSEWENNDRLKAAFPELVPEYNKTRWSDHCAVIKRPNNFTEGTYTAVGVGGSVISQHFDHILEDDLVYAKKDDFTGQELMPSQEDIDNAIGWHKLTFSLLSNPQTGCIDNTGTRWAPHDLIDYIRRSEKHYAIFEVAVTRDAMWPIPDNSFCIWPERYDIKTLENIRAAQGAKIFETQYLNRPRVGDEIKFAISYINKHITFAEYPKNMRWMTFVDLASWKDSKHICRNVVLTGGRDDKNHLWIARVDAGKYNPTRVIELIKEHVTQFASKVYIEEVGYQVALRHFARADMEAEGSFAYSIEALPFDNRANAKAFRIESLEPVVKNGMLHVMHGMSDIMAEFEDYPYASTKDIIDVAGWLHRLAKRPEVITPIDTVVDFMPGDNNRLEATFAALERDCAKKTTNQYPFPNPLVSDTQWLTL